MKVRLEKNNGQTLLEMVVAFLVATLVVIALATVTIRAIKNSQISENRTQAARYAQQAIEQVRAVRDQQGWSSFSMYGTASTAPPNNCFILNQTTSPWSLDSVSCTAGEQVGSIFTRTVKITSNGTDSSDINISIVWTESSGAQQTTLDTKLTRWQ